MIDTLNKRSALHMQFVKTGTFHTDALRTRSRRRRRARALPTNERSGRVSVGSLLWRENDTCPSARCREYRIYYHSV